MASPTRTRGLQNFLERKRVSKRVSPGYSSIAACHLLWRTGFWRRYGAQTSDSVPRGCVPRYEPWGPARIDLPRRRRPPAVYRDLGRGVRQDRLAGSCLLPHAESFSPGGRNAPAEPGCGHEMVSEHLHGTVQPPPQVVWPFVQRPLQGPDRGQCDAGVSEDRLRLRAFEPGAGEVTRA